MTPLYPSPHTHFPLLVLTRAPNLPYHIDQAHRMGRLLGQPGFDLDVYSSKPGPSKNQPKERLY